MMDLWFWLPIICVLGLVVPISVGLTTRMLVWGYFKGLLDAHQEGVFQMIDRHNSKSKEQDNG